MKYLLYILFYCISVNANEIDALLESYQTESELFKKTKDESAEHLTVYTRDDLEMMQVETLKDILKSIRIYLNQNELILPIFGSGVSLFGNIDMDFIDHVEIYEGFSSFKFGIEPASITGVRCRLLSRLLSRSSCI